jgi:hypothetical protein
MSKSLRARAIIMIDVGELKTVLIEKGYFQDKDDDNEIELEHSDIASLKAIKESGLWDYEIEDIDKLIKAIRKYGVINLYLGY